MIPRLAVNSLFKDNPMPSVRIPTPLRKLTNELEVVQASGSNIGEVLESLDQAFPGLKERICDEHGGLRRFVFMYLLYFVFLCIIVLFCY